MVLLPSAEGVFIDDGRPFSEDYVDRYFQTLRQQQSQARRRAEGKQSVAEAVSRAKRNEAEGQLRFSEDAREREREIMRQRARREHHRIITDVQHPMHAIVAKEGGVTDEDFLNNRKLRLLMGKRDVPFNFQPGGFGVNYPRRRLEPGGHLRDRESVLVDAGIPEEVVKTNPYLMNQPLRVPVRDDQRFLVGVPDWRDTVIKNERLITHLVPREPGDKRFPDQMTLHNFFLPN